MKTENVLVEELLEMQADYNPRRIAESEMVSLRKSLARWGCVEPVVVNQIGKLGRIVGGHQRVVAASLEGIKEMPVVYVALDDTEERAMNLALNRISGTWDDDKLRAILVELSEVPLFIELSGFETSEVELIVDGWKPDGEGIDAIAENDGELTARIGVLCREVDRSDVLSTIQNALDSSGIEGVRVVD